MGNKSHKGTVVSAGSGGHQDQQAVQLPPYHGSPCHYQLLEMSVTFQNNMAFNFSPGQNMISTNIDSYYPALAQPYQQGWRMTSFYRIPGVAQQQGLFSTAVNVPFQGIFVRLASDPEFCSEQYQLKVEKSIMYVATFRGGMLSLTGPQGVQGDMSDIQMKIAQNTQHGGRLVCVEMSGQYVTQGMGAAMRGVSPGIGVDVFFNMPLHPNPRCYTYQAVNVPIGIRSKMGFTPTIQVQCDWMSHYAAFLQQGWRLVEIFLDQSYMRSGAFSTSATMNTVWFFEKPADALNDPTPVYEGTIVDFEHKITGGFGGARGSAGWNPVLEDMGTRGWELACILETPEIRTTGIGQIKMKLLLFFQRKIVRQYPGSAEAAPPPPGFAVPPTAEKAEPVMTEKPEHFNQ
ncbi:raftlin-like [Lingula anatina]|uniref:Raftlin-like n=1 Tax=Lingula anatina TaxID=7574 RepID=A0A1S3J0Z7_LINAN|nr:raftlin-like [Lingula anatina]|eukprot:XP_013403484.1 raftlin-like [Lingula anatina]